MSVDGGGGWGGSRIALNAALQEPSASMYKRLSFNPTWLARRTCHEIDTGHQSFKWVHVHVHSEKLKLILKMYGKDWQQMKQARKNSKTKQNKNMDTTSIFASISIQKLYIINTFVRHIKKKNHHQNEADPPRPPQKIGLWEWKIAFYWVTCHQP